MSPKLSRPADEPDLPGLPPGHVPMRLPARPKPERKKPISLWWKLAGYVALLAATVGTIVYLGRPEDPRSSARGTAELVAKSLDDGNLSALRSYLCGGSLRSPDALANLGTTTVRSVSVENDENATASLRSRDFRGIVDLTVFLRNKDGSWCVVGVA